MNKIQYGSISEVFRDERSAKFEFSYPGLHNLAGLVGDEFLAPTVRCFGVVLDLYVRPFGDTFTQDCVELNLVRELEIIPESILFFIGIKMADGSEEVILRNQKFPKEHTKMASRFLPRRQLLKFIPRMPRNGDFTITCSFLHESLQPEKTKLTIKKSKAEEHTNDSIWRKGSLSPKLKGKTFVSQETQTESSLMTNSGKNSPENLESEDVSVLIENFKALLQSGDNHDVLITVKKKQFKAHKCVLLARSSVFAAMFRSNMEESASGTVTVEDCDPDSFGGFLQYVYTGKVDIPSVNFALGLYYACDKYDFPRLKKICVDFLKTSLSTTTISDVITLAARHGEEELLELAIVFLSKYLEEIMITVEWQRFISSNPIQANEMCIRAVRCLKTSKKE